MGANKAIISGNIPPEVKANPDASAACSGFALVFIVIPN